MTPYKVGIIKKNGAKVTERWKIRRYLLGGALDRFSRMPIRDQEEGALDFKRDAIPGSDDLANDLRRLGKV